MFGVGTGLAALPISSRLAVGPATAPLEALSLSHTSASEQSAPGEVVGLILGTSAGSALELVDDAGGRFALSGSTLLRGDTALDYEAATIHAVTLREAVGGAPNSPRDSVLAIEVVNVFEQPLLASLTLGATTLTKGTPITITITGATAGSLLTGALPPGLALDSAARTISGTPTTENPAAAWSITETLADSANSPRTTTGTVSIAPAVFKPVNSVAPSISSTGYNTGAVLSAATGTWTNSPTNYAYQWKRAGTNISGATGSTYTLTTTDSMAQITVQVTASNAAGAGSPATSAVFIASLAYTLLNDFETTTSTATAGTRSQHTGTRKVLGSAGINVVGNGSGVTAGGLTGAGTFTFNFGSRARYAVMTDLGDFAQNVAGAVKPKFVVGGTTYGYYAGAVAGMSVPTNSITYTHRGKTWQGRATKHLRVTNSAGAQLIAQGSVSASTSVDHVAQSNSAYDADYVIDALVAIDDSYKPAVIIGFDDGPKTQYDNARPGLNANSLKGTFYVPTSLIGGSLRMTLTDLQTLASEGHGMSLDSGPLDEPCTAYASPATWISSVLGGMKTALASIIGTSADWTQDQKQLCYSFGRTGLAVEYSQSVTTTGSTTVSVGGSVAHQQLCVGQRIFGTGVPTGCYITSIPSSSTIITNEAIPAQTATLTFGGWRRNMTITATGTDTVTLGSGTTTGLYVGMKIVGGANCRGRTIIALPTSTTIQFDDVIPAATTRIDLGDSDHVWWWTKTHDALIAAGYQSARIVNSISYSGPFTGFGIDPKFAMAWPPVSTAYTASSAWSADMLARLDLCIEEGTDCEFYFHDVLAGDKAEFAAFCAGVKSRVDAGLVRNLTKGQLMAEVVTRTGP